MDFWDTIAKGHRVFPPFVLAKKLRLKDKLFTGYMLSKVWHREASWKVVRRVFGSLYAWVVSFSSCIVAITLDQFRPWPEPTGSINANGGPVAQLRTVTISYMRIKVLVLILTVPLGQIAYGFYVWIILTSWSLCDITRHNDGPLHKLWISEISRNISSVLTSQYDQF